MIFIGMIGGPQPWQDFFYITGFFILLIGIIPSLFAVFLVRGKSDKINEK